MTESELLAFMGDGNPEECPNVLCQRHSIIGLEWEYDQATEALGRHSGLGRMLFCTRTRENCGCLYVHANVKYDEDAVHNAKACGRADEMLARGVLAQLVEKMKIGLLLVPDDQTSRVLGRAVRKDVRIHVVSEECPPGCLGVGRPWHDKVAEWLKRGE